MATQKQKLELARLMRKVGGDPTAFFAAQIEEITRRLDQFSPLSGRVDGLNVFLQERLAAIDLQSQAMDTRYGHRIATLKSKLSELVSDEGKRLDAELARIIGKDLADAEVLAADLKKIRDEIEGLYWARTLNGSNNVQAVLNIKSNGALVANNVTTINFTSNLTVTANADGSVTVSASGGGGGGATWYQAEQITLAGDNKTFTLAHAPTAVIFLTSGHQPQLYGVDYTGTINGTNKTFVYTNPQDPSVLNDQYATYS
jgi:hypothetical protein